MFWKCNVLVLLIEYRSIIEQQGMLDFIWWLCEVLECYSQGLLVLCHLRCISFTTLLVLLQARFLA